MPGEGNENMPNLENKSQNASAVERARLHREGIERYKQIGVEGGLLSRTERVALVDLKFSDAWRELKTISTKNKRTKDDDAVMEAASAAVEKFAEQARNDGHLTTAMKNRVASLYDQLNTDFRNTPPGSRENPLGKFLGEISVMRAASVEPTDPELNGIVGAWYETVARRAEVTARQAELQLRLPYNLPGDMSIEEMVVKFDPTSGTEVRVLNETNWGSNSDSTKARWIKHSQDYVTWLKKDSPWTAEYSAVESLTNPSSRVLTDSEILKQGISARFTENDLRFIREKSEPEISEWLKKQIKVWEFSSTQGTEQQKISFTLSVLALEKPDLAQVLTLEWEDAVTFNAKFLEFASATSGDWKQQGAAGIRAWKELFGGTDGGRRLNQNWRESIPIIKVLESDRERLRRYFDAKGQDEKAVVLGEVMNEVRTLYMPDVTIEDVLHSVRFWRLLGRGAALDGMLYDGLRPSPGGEMTGVRQFEGDDKTFAEMMSFPTKIKKNPNVSKDIALLGDTWYRDALSFKLTKDMVDRLGLVRNGELTIVSLGDIDLNQAMALDFTQTISFGNINGEPKRGSLQRELAEWIDQTMYVQSTCDGLKKWAEGVNVANAREMMNSFIHLTKANWDKSEYPAVVPPGMDIMAWRKMAIGMTTYEYLIRSIPSADHVKLAESIFANSNTTNPELRNIQDDLVRKAAGTLPVGLKEAQKVIADYGDRVKADPILGRLIDAIRALVSVVFGGRR